jgi:alkaline phosphatase D
MKQFLFVLCLLIVSCKSAGVKSKDLQIVSDDNQQFHDFTIAFGSCNKTNLPNLLWDDIHNDKPDVWIWGGDNIYADTDNAEKLKAIYDQQLAVPGYLDLLKSTKVLGTWDDHDYGLNDGGASFHFKQTSQQLFLDFLGVSENDTRRNREGVYHSTLFKLKNGKIKIIVLDTRYFRSDLTDATDRKKRYQPNPYGEGTILGEEQWKWFTNELNSSDADFNVIVTSIQLLSDKHGYETWGNFPHEVEKFKALIAKSKAKGVIVLSGDRHISDFSTVNVKGLAYPLIDFTSSGLTHAATNNKGEENPYRTGKMVNKVSYGILKFDFKNGAVKMQMKGNGGVVQQSLIQKY